MSQVLPGVRVVPHQGDDPEQHRRRAQDDPTVQCRLHTAKLTEMSGSDSGNENLPGEISFRSTRLVLRYVRDCRVIGTDSNAEAGRQREHVKVFRRVGFLSIR